MVVAGANVHDTKLLRQTLENIVVARPDGPGESPFTLSPTSSALSIAIPLSRLGTALQNSPTQSL